MASGYVHAGNLGIPIATYALGNAAEVAPVMLFQLTVLAPLFTTVLGLTSARADGQRPPLWRTLTAPVRNPIALASAADLTVSATGLRPPDPVLARVELIGNLAVPAMLLAFGLSLRGAPRPGAADSGPSLLAVLLLKRARGGAEFVAEQDAQLLVGRERLRLVAPGGERAHQQQVAGLPHRRRRHQLSGGAFGGGQLGSAQLQAGGGVALQGADAGVGQPAAPPVDPGFVASGSSVRRATNCAVSAAYQARRQLPEATADSAVCSAASACSTSTRAGSPSTTDSCPRPWITPGPTTARSRETTTVSAALAEGGGTSSHSASISASRGTGCDRHRVT
jgi:hypothetical protein